MTEEEVRERCIKDRDFLQQCDRKRWAEENAPKVGKWFKYLNSYGTGKPWWLYGKVTGLHSYSSLTMFQFSTDCHGWIEVKERDTSYLSSWVPCTEKEARIAWRKIVTKIIRIQAKTL